MATRRWLGAALDVAQVDTITIANTWAANDTVTVTINGRDITMTVGATATTTQVATELAAVLSSASSSLGTGYSATERGPNIAEFREFSAAVSGSTVVLTAVTKGKPLTITSTENTAGNGTAALTNTTAATGKHFFSNADNWTGATVPVSGDTAVFDSGNISCKYGLAQTTVTPAILTITAGYTGSIGLPITNVDDGQYPYPEYRARYLAIGDADDTTNMAVTIGAGDGAGSPRIMLDFGDGQATINVYNSGRAEIDGEKAIQIKGTHASNVLNVNKGTVSVAPIAGETATIATLRVGYRTNIAGDSDVFLGSGVTLTTVNQSGGKITTNGAFTTLNMTDGELLHLSGAVTTINLEKGIVRYRSSGTLSALIVGSDGVFDCSQDMQSRTISAVDLFEGATYLDPFGTVTLSAGIDLNHCTPEDVTLKIAHHKRITLGSVA